MNSKHDKIEIETTQQISEPVMTCSLSKKEILKKIIEEEGSCEWMFDEYPGQDVCKNCPFNKLKKKDKFNFFCCYEAVFGTTRPVNEEEEYRRYKETALQLLVDMVVAEECLGQDPDFFESEFDE